jgi:hypothetical protein
MGELPGRASLRRGRSSWRPLSRVTCHASVVERVERLEYEEKEQGGIAVASAYHAVLAVNGLRADFRGINGRLPTKTWGPLHLFHDPRAIH